MTKRLIELKPGERGSIIRIEESSVLRKRLREMGVREGKEIEMRRDAPMGDPMEISVMDYNISIRRSEAEHIIIEQSETKRENINGETSYRADREPELR